MSKVLVLLADGFEEIEAVTVIDLLRRANVEVVTAALFKKNVSGAHNINMQADSHIDDIDESSFDMVVLPGGMPGSQHLAKSPRVKEILQNMNANNKILAAICAAPWALWSAGVLRGSYTCYPSFEDIIGKAGYIEDADVVSDANIITSRGPSTAFAFALELIKELKGERVLESIEKELLLK